MIFSRVNGREEVSESFLAALKRKTDKESLLREAST